MAEKQPRARILAKQIASEDDVIALARADILTFSKYALGYSGDYSLWACQREWQALASASYLERLRDPQEGRHLCLLAPSEHGKTYGIDIPFILWVLGRNRNLRIGVVGSKDDLAQKIGQGIDRLFKTRGHILTKFGLEPGIPWNVDKKFLVRDDDKLLDPSIMFLGPESELQGVRFDIIFMTDIATFKNQRSEESRRKLREWIFNSLFPRLEPWGFVMAEGHHVDAQDIYNEFQEDEEAWKVVKYRAIIEEPCHENGNTAKLLAPEQWSYKQLARIRHRAPSTFQLIYQNNPIEKVGTISREVLERQLDRSRPLLNSPIPEMKLAYKEFHMGFDLAFSTNRWSKYSTCLVVGVTDSGQEDVLAGWRLRLLPDQLRAKIVGEILKWRPVLTKAHIEANAAQVYVVDDVRKALGAGLGSIVNPVYTESSDPETMPAAAVGAIVTAFQGGKATLPYGNNDAQVLSDQIINELVDYPGKYTDLVMAWVVLSNGRKREIALENRQVKFQGISRAIARNRWRRF